MSRERCPDCGVIGDECGCVPGGFEPLRVRPYVTLPNPGGAATPPPPRPESPGAAGARPAGAPAAGGQAPGAQDAGETVGANPAGARPPGARPPAAPAAGAPRPVGASEADTPAYGTPVPAWPDETMQLRPVPPYDAAYDPPYDPTPPRRRIRPLLLIAAAATLCLGTAALALTTLPGSDTPEVTLLDAKPTAPVVSLAPVAPSQGSASPKATPSASPSPSASRSASASPSPSPSPSRSSAPPSPSPSPSRSSSAPPSAQPATLQYGDSGPEVEKLQRLLAAQHLYQGKFDGKYGSRTESAVSTFQWDNGIEDDPWGVYGPATRRALEG